MADKYIITCNFEINRLRSSIHILKVKMFALISENINELRNNSLEEKLLLMFARLLAHYCKILFKMPTPLLVATTNTRKSMVSQGGIWVMRPRALHKNHNWHAKKYFQMSFHYMAKMHRSSKYFKGAHNSCCNILILWSWIMTWWVCIVYCSQTLQSNTTKLPRYLIFSVNNTVTGRASYWKLCYTSTCRNGPSTMCLINSPKIAGDEGGANRTLLLL